MNFKYLNESDLNYNDTPSPSPPSPSPSSSKKSSTNVGAIIGIILLSLFALAILGFTIFLLI